MKSRTSSPVLEVSQVNAIDLRVLQSLFDLTPDIAFFVKDAEGRYLAVNDSLIARHGLKNKTAAIGRRPQDICAGDFGRIPTEQDKRVLRTGRALIDCLELQWYRPGKPVWCLTSKLPLREADGKVNGLIGFSCDLRAPVAAHELPQEFATAFAAFEQNLNSNFSPAILSSKSKLSPTRLARLTKRLFSLTPSQLITKTRMTAASHLLLETKLAIAEVAQHCGYSDQSAFTRAFRSVAGMTPLEYRRRELDRSFETGR
jgi:AraC-like DNA-binding protein